MKAEIRHDTPKLAYRIDEAVKASGLGRSFLYERMADGSLKSVKIGGRRLILREDLMAFLKCETPVAFSSALCSGEAQGTGAPPQALVSPVTLANSQIILPLE